ncbi:MAG: SMI1/KNR4 family protein [Lachnospiraceae bacterium]|nr:SMI1/KNR4 family protein [Lachnospiraceae bacterium]
MFDIFIDYLVKNGWKFTIEYNESVMLNNDFVHKKKLENLSYYLFIKKYKELYNNDATIWFNCIDDYNENTESAFAWNEFELLSLENALDNEQHNTIKEWWKKIIPIIISVKDGYYKYYAISIGDNFGKVIMGHEPEFEEVDVIAENFEDFIEKVTKNIIII